MVRLGEYAIAYLAKLENERRRQKSIERAERELEEEYLRLVAGEQDQ